MDALIPPPLPVPFTLALDVSHVRLQLVDDMLDGQDPAELAWADLSDFKVNDQPFMQ